MSDPTREALERLFRQYGLDGVEDRLAEDVLAEFLVVPRADIVGTEYGYRSSDEDLACLTDDRKDAINGALGRRQWQRDAMFQPTAEAVERPSLPWSPIPLPEDGDGIA